MGSSCGLPYEDTWADSPEATPFQLQRLNRRSIRMFRR